MRPDIPQATGHAIDELFRELKAQLPAPSTLSESNGHSLVCTQHGDVTYTRLSVLARRVLIRSDQELPALIRWCRDSDPCIRQIALEALMPRCGLRRAGRAAQAMHDPEHIDYYVILAKLKEYFDKSRIAYNPQLFDGLHIDLTKKMFLVRVQGTWIEEISPGTVNLFSEITIDDPRVVLTQRHRDNDPAPVEEAIELKIRRVERRPGGQYILQCDVAADHTPPIEPAPTRVPIARRLWAALITNDVLWYKNETNTWTKLRRAVA